MNTKLKPKLFSVIKNYSKEQLMKDVISGVIVAIIALPLSIALALASGVGPEQGIYTAIVAGFLISFFGGTRVQIAGPTAAFATIVAGIVAKNGMDGLIAATIMAGILLILMGIFRLGSLIKFIPFTITTGFTAGIAVTIVIGQLKDFMGLTYPEGLRPVETIEKIEAIAESISTINPQAVLVGVISLAILILWPRFEKKIPPSLIAVIAGILIVKFTGLKVNTIGDLYTISGGLPPFRMPHITVDIIKTQFPDAVTIAILAAIESLLSAVVADGMINSHHNSNMELVAQGIGNMGSALFGGIPATGAIARTAANIKNGGRTPIAGMVHSVVLLLVLLVLMPYAVLIPMPTIAAILFIVAYNMCGYEKVVLLCKRAPKSDIFVLISTLILTIVFDLVVAIEFGMLAACVLFMKRMSDETEIYGWKEYNDRSVDPEAIEYRKLPEATLVYEVNGPLFFGMTDQIARITAGENTKVLIIRMRGVPSIDASAMYTLENLMDKCVKNKVTLVFSHVNPQPMEVFRHGGFYDRVGEDNFCSHIDTALERAEKLVSG